MEVSMNIHELNKIAWDHAVTEGSNPYTQVISSKKIAAAKQGIWSLYLRTYPKNV
jgi:hypothetical protein